MKWRNWRRFLLDNIALTCPTKASCPYYLLTLVLLFSVVFLQWPEWLCVSRMGWRWNRGKLSLCGSRLVSCLFVAVLPHWHTPAAPPEVFCVCLARAAHSAIRQGSIMSLLLVTRPYFSPTCDCNWSLFLQAHCSQLILHILSRAWCELGPLIHFLPTTILVFMLSYIKFSSFVFCRQRVLETVRS